MTIGVKKLRFVESFRGNLAAWMLIAFGLVYLVWALRRIYRNKAHAHTHHHRDREYHEHEHNHHRDHAHVHDKQGRPNIAPWTLFVIFVFGPCEPLIPILMYPAAKNSLFGLVVVTFVFAAATIATMLGVVLLSVTGAGFIQFPRLQRFSHVIAGTTILLCGMAIVFLGL